MSGLLLLLAAGLAAAAILLLAGGGRAWKRRHRAAGSLATLTALLLATLAALFATFAVGIRGYRALTREELAATVSTRPVGPQEFRAAFRFPDGRTRSFRLKGDQLYVDAHILKWKTLLNLLGLHTAYELDRVAGRYESIEQERSAERTVFSLAEDRPIDLFRLRRRFGWLSPLVDAEYGSATFIGAARPATFELRVSTTGLLIRRVDQSARPSPPTVSRRAAAAARRSAGERPGR